MDDRKGGDYLDSKFSFFGLDPSYLLSFCYFRYAFVILLTSAYEMPSYALRGHFCPPVPLGTIWILTYELTLCR